MARNKIRAPIRNGRLNIAGLNIKNIRTKKFPELSQNGLAALVQLQGITMTKNTVQRMEAGEGAINDIQLKAFANALEVSVEVLLDETVYQNQSQSQSQNQSQNEQITQPNVNTNSSSGTGGSSDKFGNLEVAEKTPDYS